MDDIILKAITILDINANDGEFSIYCAKLNDAVNIYAFESSSVLLPLLKNNIKNYENITILNYAMGHKIGLVKSNKKEEFINISGLYVPVNNEEVQMITIDSLNLTKCELIKLDGLSEEYILLGAKKTIERLHPAILFKNKSISDVLKDMNYEIHYDNKQYYIAIYKLLIS